jgi:hypothetical protein
MTLSTQTPRVVITGNGTRGPYSLVDGTSQAIRFTSTSHVRLTRYNAATDDNNDGSVLVENTDYTIGGTQDARTFTLASSEDVLTSNQRSRARSVVFSRPLSYDRRQLQCVSCTNPLRQGRGEASGAEGKRQSRSAFAVC